VIKQDLLEKQANIVYISIGSNLGNRVSNLEKTKFLINFYGINIVKSSNYYESLSWPNINNPKFLNIVILIKTNFSPEKLMKIFKEIEVKLGRKKSKKNSPRECDIDIIDYKSIVSYGKITLPHKRMHKRNFVLFPLFELNKNWRHPLLKLNIKKLIFFLSNKDIRSIKQI